MIFPAFDLGSNGMGILSIVFVMSPVNRNAAAGDFSAVEIFYFVFKQFSLQKSF